MKNAKIQLNGAFSSSFLLYVEQAAAQPPSDDETVLDAEMMIVSDTGKDPEFLLGRSPTAPDLAEDAQLV